MRYLNKQSMRRFFLDNEAGCQYAGGMPGYGAFAAALLTAASLAVGISTFRFFNN